jgi:hypothetical protein
VLVLGETGIGKSELVRRLDGVVLALGPEPGRGPGVRGAVPGHLARCADALLAARPEVLVLEDFH